MQEKEASELTLYVAKIKSVTDKFQKSFIRVIADYPKESLWIELPGGKFPDTDEYPRDKLMEDFIKVLKPFVQKCVTKRQEFTNRTTESWRARYSNEFLSTGSIRLEQDKVPKRWNDFKVPMTDDEIAFFSLGHDNVQLVLLELT